jgi:hypothetical protein
MLEAQAEAFQHDDQVVHDPPRLGFDTLRQRLAVIVRVRGHLTGE